MPAHALAEQLFPAVSILGHGRISVFFLQAGIVRIGLLVAVIDASGRGIEESPDAEFLGRLEHVGIDQHREHAQGFVVLDKPHAAHIRREIVDFGGALGGLLAVLFQVQVQNQVVGVVENLIPLRQRLDVDGANSLVALASQFGHHGAADKPARPGDQDQIVFHASAYGNKEQPPQGSIVKSMNWCATRGSFATRSVTVTSRM